MVMVGFSKIDESYYFALDCTCNSCGYIFKNEDIVIIRGGRLDPLIYCKNCLGKIPKLIFDNEYQIMARGINKMPNNCLILNLKRGIELENGQIDVWDMEKLNKLGGQTIDHTKFMEKPQKELENKQNKQIEDKQK